MNQHTKAHEQKAAAPSGGDFRDAMDAAAGGPEPRQQVDAPIQALAEQTLAVDLARAEIDQLILTAHKYPRNVDVVERQIEQLALRNEAAADNCVYALPRDGKAIVGPSIGFANIIAGAWGNCWDYGRWLNTDRREGVVVAEGIFVDWQTNRRLAVTVQRRITGKTNRLYSNDMIVVTSQAATQIARRNAILNAVPRALWFPVYEKALYIVRGTEATLPERREKGVKALAAFGVDPTRVLMFLGVKAIGDIGIEHIPTLRGMYAQLRDGAMTAEEMFDPRRMMGKGFEVVTNPLADQDGDPTDPATGITVQQTTDGAQSAASASAQAGAQAAPADMASAPEAAAGAQAPTVAKAEPEPAADDMPDVQTVAAAQQSAKQPAAAAEPAAQAVTLNNPEEYVAHLRSWIEELPDDATESLVQQRWRAEKQMRTNCRVVGQPFDEAAKIKDDKLREIKTAATAQG